MDFELFCNRMKSDRAWDVSRCRAEWQKLSADPALEHDMGGPLHSKERNEIPSNLAGEEEQVHRDIAFQERRLDTSTKAKPLKEPDVCQIRGELSRGFDRMDVNKLRDEGHLALPANAITVDPSPRKELKDLMSMAFGGRGSYA